MTEYLLSITGSTHFDQESLLADSVALFYCRDEPATPGTVKSLCVTGKLIMVHSAITAQQQAFVQAWIADNCPEWRNLPVRQLDFSGDILSPGFVDLQVNGGGGRMFNDAPNRDTLAMFSAIHRAGATVGFLPTLITDTPETTRRAVDAVVDATKSGMHGIAGLHLEGPHLSVKRCGAHDPALVRAMSDDDLGFLLDAAAQLPVLMVTVAPESVSLEQARQMLDAGVLLSLGHTDADYSTCCSFIDAGVRLVTHLFNAMSPLTSRNPGLVGAVLSHPNVSAGLIADGIHVHPGSMRSAWNSRRGQGRIFLVTDAMATAGTDMQSFTLNGRKISRQDGSLRLADGTLAGADLDMLSAVRTLHQSAGVPLVDALAAAITVPRTILKSDGNPAMGNQDKSGNDAADYIRIDRSLAKATPFELW